MSFETEKQVGRLSGQSAAELDLPWLLFKLKQNVYTINSGIVTSIQLLPEDVTPVATSMNVFRGIINFRGSILPLLDMRRFFGLQTILEEHAQIVSTLTAIKNSHQEWVQALKETVYKSAPFTKATDPTKCMLGKFLQSSAFGSHAMAVAQKNIIPVHDKFHAVAGEVLAIRKDLSLSKEERDSRMQKKYLEAEGYLPTIISLIDAIDTAFLRSNTEMVIVVSNGSQTLGIVVDEVLAVDQVEIITDEENFPEFQEKDYFVGVAHSSKVPGEILLISEDTLIGVIKKYEDSLRN